MSAFGGKADMTLCGNLRSLLGVKWTSLFATHMSAFDPKRTWGGRLKSLVRTATMPYAEPRGAFMRRRDFVKIIAGSAAASPLTAHAQQGERVRRIGVLQVRYNLSNPNGEPT
jgi:hypothetical protein